MSSADFGSLSPLSRARALLASLRGTDISAGQDGMCDKADHAEVMSPPRIPTPDALAASAVGRRTHHAVVARTRSRVRRTLESSLATAISRSQSPVDSIDRDSTPTVLQLGRHSSLLNGHSDNDSTSSSSAASDSSITSQNSGNDHAQEREELLARTLNGKKGMNGASRFRQSSPSFTLSRSIDSLPALRAHETTDVERKIRIRPATNVLDEEIRPRYPKHEELSVRSALAPCLSLAAPNSPGRPGAGIRVPLAVEDSKDHPQGSRRTPRPAIPESSAASRTRFGVHRRSLREPVSQGDTEQKGRIRWFRGTYQQQVEPYSAVINGADTQHSEEAAALYRRTADVSSSSTWIVDGDSTATATGATWESISHMWDRLRLLLARVAMDGSTSQSEALDRIAQLVDALQSRTRSAANSSTPGSISGSAQAPSGQEHDLLIARAPPPVQLGGVEAIMPPSGEPPPMSPAVSVPSTCKSEQNDSSVLLSDTTNCVVVDDTGDSTRSQHVVVEGIALADFIGDPNEHQISIKKNQVVIVVKQFDSGWWFVRPRAMDRMSIDAKLQPTETGGYVPGTYLATRTDLPGDARHAVVGRSETIRTSNHVLPAARLISGVTPAARERLSSALQSQDFAQNHSMHADGSKAEQEGGGDGRQTPVKVSEGMAARMNHARKKTTHRPKPPPGPRPRSSKSTGKTAYQAAGSAQPSKSGSAPRFGSISQEKAGTNIGPPMTKVVTTSVGLQPRPMLRTTVQSFSTEGSSDPASPNPPSVGVSRVPAPGPAPGHIDGTMHRGAVVQNAPPQHCTATQEVLEPAAATSGRPLQTRGSTDSDTSSIASGSLSPPPVRAQMSPLDGVCAGAAGMEPVIDGGGEHSSGTAIRVATMRRGTNGTLNAHRHPHPTYSRAQSQEYQGGSVSRGASHSLNLPPATVQTANATSAIHSPQMASNVAVASRKSVRAQGRSREASRASPGAFARQWLLEGLASPSAPHHSVRR